MTPTPRTPKTTATAVAESPSAAASRYQQLRSHLAELKLHAAAEALPSVLDQATAEGLSLTIALERLLAVEVDASTARRLAGRLRFACLPTPATLADFDVDAAAGCGRNVDPTTGGQLFQKQTRLAVEGSHQASSLFQKRFDLASCLCVARPSKGDRGAHMVRTHDGVAQLLVDKVAASGVSSVSQYVADILAIHVGLPALVREYKQAACSGVGARKVAALQGGRIMIRPNREVSERLAHMAAEAGYPAGRVSPYIADVLAEHVGIRRLPATATASGQQVQPMTGREAARAEMRRLAARATERRAEQAAREAARREATVRALRRVQPE